MDPNTLEDHVTPNAAVSASSRRLSILLLILAPFVTVVYYIALRSAFLLSKTYIVGGVSDINLSQISHVTWGSHWIFRLVAEGFAISFGTFVAAGLVHQRERLAAVIGGLAISVIFFVRLLFLLFSYLYLDPDSYRLNEPNLQYIIDAVAMVIAPFIGAAVSNAAAEMHNDKPAGFGGINPWHFVWLWLAAWLYALGLLVPLSNFMFLKESGWNVFADFLQLLAYGVPVLVLFVPLVWGLSLLAASSGRQMSPLARNAAGISVLVVGFLVGVFLQVFWAKLLTAIFG